MKRAKAQQKDKPSKDHPPRASSTDPEARMMRMPDGGTRPAYNLELAADCDSRAIVGVATTNAGSDAGQDQPMRDQVEARADEAVAEQLIDGGFCRLESIERAAVEEVVIYVPVPEPRKAGVDRYAPKPTDSAAVAEWRQRMGTDAAKGVYKQRSSTVETINGELKTYRGLVPLLVRGLRKVQCEPCGRRWRTTSSTSLHTCSRAKRAARSRVVAREDPRFKRQREVQDTLAGPRQGRQNTRM